VSAAEMIDNWKLLPSRSLQVANLSLVWSKYTLNPKFPYSRFIPSSTFTTLRQWMQTKGSQELLIGSLTCWFSHNSGRIWLIPVGFKHCMHPISKYELRNSERIGLSHIVMSKNKFPWPSSHQLSLSRELLTNFLSYLRKLPVKCVASELN